MARGVAWLCGCVWEILEFCRRPERGGTTIGVIKYVLDSRVNRVSYRYMNEPFVSTSTRKLRTREKDQNGKPPRCLYAIKG